MVSKPGRTNKKEVLVTQSSHDVILYSTYQFLYKCVFVHYR